MMTFTLYFPVVCLRPGAYVTVGFECVTIKLGFGDFSPEINFYGHVANKNAQFRCFSGFLFSFAA
jgi:hypothetical protein